MRRRALCVLVLLFAPGILAAAAVGAPNAPVADAAMRGDVEALRRLLRGGADVNLPQADGMTALHWAALAGDGPMAEMLIYAGAHLESGTRLGSYTPLHLASQRGNVPVVAVLLEAGADPNGATTSGGARPLHFAAAAGNVEVIELLLGAMAAVDGREDTWHQTPLMFAAASDRVAAVQALLAGGADVSLAAKVVDIVEQETADREESRRRSRQRAALRALEEEETESEGESGEQESAEASGEEGPEGEEAVEGEEGAAAEEAAEGDEAQVDPEGEQPAKGDEAATAAGEEGEAAAEDEKEEEATAKDGVAAAGDETEEEATGKEGATAAGDEAEGEAAGEEAEAGGEEESETDKNDDPEEEKRPPTYGELVGGHGGLTALLYAAREGHVETVMTLLDSGADIDGVSGGDHTSPLLIATLNGHFDLAMMLLERGADPNVASNAGATPLYGALNVRWAPRSAYPQQNAYKQQQTDYLELMTALLEAGSDADLRLEKHLWYTSFNFDHLLNSAGATPFWRAAYATDVPAMRLLTAHGADPGIPTRKLPSRGRARPQGEDGKEEEEEDPSGLPEVPIGGPAIYPLHAASGAGYGENFAGYAHQHAPDGWAPAVRYLVEEQGADVNARDHKGYNAVHHAAARGDFEMILYLVARGADPTAISRNGQTTADMANGPIQRIQPFPRAIWLLEKLGSKNNDNCVSC